MEYHVVTAAVGLAGEFYEPRKNKLIELLRSEYEVTLGAEVIAEKETVDQVACLVEEAFVCLIVETADAVRYGVDHFRVGVHVDHVALHPEQIHHIVEEGRPEAAGAVAVPCPAQEIEAFL